MGEIHSFISAITPLSSQGLLIVSSGKNFKPGWSQ
jgi:hypothetical protein